MGQGLHTALAQICADQLDVSPEAVDVVSGDTSFVSLGMGGFGSRQTITAGSSVQVAARKVREKALKVAAQMLEAAETDLELAQGTVRVAGTNRSVTLGAISRLMRGAPGYSLPAGVEPGLESGAEWRTDEMAYAHSVQGCEVEVDAETGGVRILRYVALQDSGKLVNPMIVEGQVHGGVVHGIGNALFEWMGFDENAQPITTTFADYLLPTATDFPHVAALTFEEAPSRLNPLGAKGAGEGGIVAVGAAVGNAVAHALAPLGVTITAMPLSLDNLARAIRAARAERAA